MSDMALGQSGVIQVIPEDVLQQQEADRARMQAQANQAPVQNPQQLSAYIKGQWEIFRNHRNTSAGWSERLLICLRTFNGQYDANQLKEIRRFGGSEVYARVIAQKCRAASSLLRDIYLGDTRPWAVKPPAAPKIPDEIQQNIDALMKLENQMVTQQQGKPPDPNDVQQRRTALIESALDAAKKKAVQQARDSDDKIEDILREGHFYRRLAEFLVDLPIFPFGVICGPKSRLCRSNLAAWRRSTDDRTEAETHLASGRAVRFVVDTRRRGHSQCRYYRKTQITRAELNDLLDLPGYNQTNSGQSLTNTAVEDFTITGTPLTPKELFLKIKKTLCGTGPA